MHGQQSKVTATCCQGFGTLGGFTLSPKPLIFEQAGAHMRRESTIMRCVTGWLPDTVLPQPEKLSSCTYCAVSVM